MSTSNFLQYNPSQANQLDDASYATDSFRLGGAGVEAICPSDSFNKMLYQLSTCVAALNAFLAGQGYAVDDSNLASLTSTYASAFLTKADIVGGVTTVPFSSSPVFNGSLATGFYMALSGDVTSSTLTNVTPGNIVTFALFQDVTGHHNFTFPPNLLVPGVISVSPYSFSVQQFFILPNGQGMPTGAMVYNG